MDVKIAAFQKIALALSIIVVLNLVFNLGIGTFYHAPKYDSFCGAETRQIYTTEDACEGVGGEWIGVTPEVSGDRSPVPASPVPAKVFETGEPRPYCNAQATCSKNFNAAQSLYNRNVFIALVILSVLAIGAGFATSKVKAVSTGFLFGGFISLIVSSMRYWSDMNEYLRFGILLCALAVLVWFGYSKLKDKD